MIALRKISEETLAKASVLTHQQMSKVVGRECLVRCDQGTAEKPGAITGTVSSCDRDAVQSYCGSIDKALCSCFL